MFFVLTALDVADTELETVRSGDEVLFEIRQVRIGLPDHSQ